MVQLTIALQLSAANPHYPGRLLWCGHRADPTFGRVSPVWASDDHGAHYRLTSVFPLDVIPGPAQRYGPDEGVMTDLPNGDVRYDARNNYPAASQTGHDARMVSLSHDARMS